MTNIIDSIHELFIQEAKRSPLLFNDLANMENYISESYAGRSIIELLQNADDAKAENVYIKKNNDYLVVANNGRKFTNDDLLALCRSGASTKQRNSETIGYRGIGFKSVVNYASVVHLVSGDIKITFSRKLTVKELSNADKVPLIRVPHRFIGEQYLPEIVNLQNKGYNTVFVFEIQSNSFDKELKDFSDDCLLFLNCIKNVIIETAYSKIYYVDREQFENNIRLIRVTNSNISKSWIIFDNETTSIAFKFENGIAVPADIDESVIHSFLPTNDRFSIRAKINGDFSTDPSRTRIVQDTATKETNLKIVKLIADIFEKILVEKNDNYHLISVIKYAMIDPLAKIKGENANDIIIKNLQAEIKKRLNIIADGRIIVLQPKGITDDDFYQMVEIKDIYGVGNKEEVVIPGIIEFLKTFGFEELPIESCLEAMRYIECSEKTRSAVIIDTIRNTKLRNTKFGMSARQKDLIINANLFRFETGVKPILQAKEDKIEEVFEGVVIENLISDVDYTTFAKKIGLKDNQLALNYSHKNIEHIITGSDANVSIKMFKSDKVIKKWRSVEQNVAAVLGLMDNVISVKDVSKQNIGYDLETIFLDGTIRYYEVKSVEKLGETISFSNNEYSTCMQLKNNYYLAITEQTSNEISICIIKNPVEKLHFEKRITRWDWQCNEYEGEVINAKME